MTLLLVSLRYDHPGSEPSPQLSSMRRGSCLLLGKVLQPPPPRAFLPGHVLRLTSPKDPHPACQPSGDTLLYSGHPHGRDSSLLAKDTSFIHTLDG